MGVEWFRKEFYNLNIPHIVLRPNFREKVFKKIPEHKTNSCKYLLKLFLKLCFHLGNLKTETIIGQNIILSFNGKSLFRAEQHKSFEANGSFRTLSEFQYSPY